jgi:hypothetical protein
MGLARRSLTAFRMTEQERAEVTANDTDWVLDPSTGVLEAEPDDEPEVPLAPHRSRPRIKVRVTFPVPDITFD